MAVTGGLEFWLKGGRESMRGTATACRCKAAPFQQKVVFGQPNNIDAS